LVLRSKNGETKPPFVGYIRQTVKGPGCILGGMLGQELKKARRAAGMTQEALAFAARVDRTYLSELENDKSSPTLDCLMRLCAALDIRASDFIARIENAKQKPRHRKP
jgi:transcriptional regulator with XRE-family HTH domain